MQSIFFLFIYTKFYSQKSEWDWAAGIAYFSPLPIQKGQGYTHYISIILKLYKFHRKNKEKQK